VNGDHNFYDHMSDDHMNDDQLSRDGGYNYDDDGT
jgi:hypothetical protein